ncbi:hypothetical protein BD413DRAFT_645078 [Trametes elegans]|nr:hypothetical protein BD413DRAFT_645078 [Trametes elegans]
MRGVRTEWMCRRHGPPQNGLEEEADGLTGPVRRPGSEEVRMRREGLAGIQIHVQCQPRAAGIAYHGLLSFELPLVVFSLTPPPPNPFTRLDRHVPTHRHKQRSMTHETTLSVGLSLTTDIFGTACLLQQQVQALEERCRTSEEREVALRTKRTELQDILNLFMTIEKSEARATADLTYTLLRLRRGSPTASPTASQGPVINAPGRSTSPNANAAAHKADASFSSTELPSPLARLARDALQRSPICSSPRAPFRPYEADADADEDPHNTRGGTQAGAASHSHPGALPPPASAPTAEHTPPRAMQGSAPSPNPGRGRVRRKAPPPFPAGLSPSGKTSAGGPPHRRDGRDPRLQAVALGAHVVTAARAGEGPADPADGTGGAGLPSLDGLLATVDKEAFARAYAAALASGTHPGRLARGPDPATGADASLPAGRVVRLGGHEIAAGGPADGRPTAVGRVLQIVSGIAKGAGMRRVAAFKHKHAHGRSRLGWHARAYGGASSARSPRRARGPRLRLLRGWNYNSRYFSKWMPVCLPMPKIMTANGGLRSEEPGCRHCRSYLAGHANASMPRANGRLLYKKAISGSASTECGAGGETGISKFIVGVRRSPSEFKVQFDPSNASW